MQEYQAHLYQQAYLTLREIIEGVEYEPGDRIPAERELANTLGISRMTVRRALEALIGEGLLERRSTRGTYVCQPQVVRQIAPNSVQSLSSQIQQGGGFAGSQLLSFNLIRAPRKIALNLKLRLGSQVYEIHRLRLVNKTPICIETSYLPRDLFPNLNQSDLEGNVSLYKILQDRYGICATHSDDRLSISYATEFEAQCLNLVVNDAILLIRSVIMDEKGQPVEYLKSINHPKQVVFQGLHAISN